MPIYLWQASYHAAGTQGLLKEGGTKREAAVRMNVEKLGGRPPMTLEAFISKHRKAFE